MGLEVFFFRKEEEKNFKSHFYWKIIFNHLAMIKYLDI
jgi:hypothetical protein